MAKKNKLSFLMLLIFIYCYNARGQTLEIIAHETIDNFSILGGVDFSKKVNIENQIFRNFTGIDYYNPVKSQLTLKNNRFKISVKEFYLSAQEVKVGKKVVGYLDGRPSKKRIYLWWLNLPDSIKEVVKQTYKGEFFGEEEVTYKQINTISSFFLSNEKKFDLSYYKGDNLKKDLEFLEDLEHLNVLKIFNGKFDDLTILPDIQDLKVLDVHNNGLISFKGLDKFLKIEILVFDDNKISNLNNVEKLIKLRHISGNENIVTSLSPLTSLSILESVSFSSNQLSDLSHLNDKLSLRIIKFDNNQEIKGLSSIKGCSGLWSMSFAGCGVQTIPSELFFSELIRAEFRFNEITDISGLSNSRELEELTLRGNKVVDLAPLKNSENLRHLDVRDNNISNIIPICELPRLQYLNCDNNNIKFLPVLIRLNRLREFYISYNNLTNISEISNLKSLVSFSCVGNDKRINHFFNPTKLPNLKRLIFFQNTVNIENANIFLKRVDRIIEDKQLSLFCIRDLFY